MTTEPAPTADAAGPLRVLVADDTPDLRALLKVVLELADGVSVVAEAGDGRQAVALAEQLRPDAVLLDLAMPVMDGLEALPLLREALPDAALLVLSGFARDELMPEALRRGADGYVQKGAEPSAIVTALLEALRSRRSTGAALPRARLAPPQDAIVAADALYDITHELQNPITAITGLATMLERRWDDLDEDRRRAMVGDVLRQGQRLQLLVQDLLSSAHAATGRLVVEPVPTVLATAVRAALADVPGAQAAFAVDCPDDLVVAADPVRLDQVLTNHLSNALKYGAPPFALLARADGALAHLEVRDRGPGVPADLRGRLYSRFARARDTSRPGTGLGLYLARELVRAHGGEAWHTTPDDGGSAFHVTLPLAGARLG